MTQSTRSAAVRSRLLSTFAALGALLPLSIAAADVLPQLSAADVAQPAGWDDELRMQEAQDLNPDPRVLEIDPVKVEKVWEYSLQGLDSYRFFSHYVSSAQRLPNGNTLITEGADGRLLEVTTSGEIVWEYVSPYFGTNQPVNRVYRAYRLPYEWVPQLAKPVERPVVAPDVKEFRVPAQ